MFLIKRQDLFFAGRVACLGNANRRKQNDKEPEKNERDKEDEEAVDDARARTVLGRVQGRAKITERTGKGRGRKQEKLKQAELEDEYSEDGGGLGSDIARQYKQCIFPSFLVRYCVFSFIPAATQSILYSHCPSTVAANKQVLN